MGIIGKGVNGIRQFIPGCFQFAVKGFSFWRQGEIFTGWPGIAFHPTVGEHVCIFEPGQQGIQGTFQDVQIGGLHLFHDVGWVRFTAPDYGEDAELQDPFSHLTLGILDIHTLSFFMIPARRPPWGTPETSL